MYAWREINGDISMPACMPEYLNNYDTMLGVAMLARCNFFSHLLLNFILTGGREGKGSSGSNQVTLRLYCGCESKALSGHG